MALIKIGLAPKRVSFYDPLTNTYLTLDNPVKTVDTARFSNEEQMGLCRGLFSQNPAIVLYEGKLSEEVIELWKSKYDVTKQMKERTNSVQNEAEPVVQGKAADKEGKTETSESKQETSDLGNELKTSSTSVPSESEEVEKKDETQKKNKRGRKKKEDK